jgi:hypothetical protein
LEEKIIQIEIPIKQISYQALHSRRTSRVSELLVYPVIPWIAKRLRMGHPSPVTNSIQEAKG